MDNRSILNLVDSALGGDPRTVQMAIRSLASKIRTSDQELYRQLTTRLEAVSLRKVEQKIRPIPVDADSRLNLVRVENPVIMTKTPLHADDVKSTLEQVILERHHTEALIKAGLSPSRSLIFQGPPGVGKTMTARWLAAELNLPLLVLDLATVMSSFLGKTGSNVRAVLEHATSFPCVLLLDEFDAIAKRRDDDRELGELKRLVTVLLQAIDDWPNSSLLIAATNHGELLDPAIWRRFDLEVTFNLPNQTMIAQYLTEYWPDAANNINGSQSEFTGKSFSFIDRQIKKAKRESILSGLSINPCFVVDKTCPTEHLTLDEKKNLVRQLYSDGMSQRAIAIELGLSRPTVKKALEETADI